MKEPMRVLLVCFVPLAVAATTGCGKMGGVQSKSAIRVAIEAHLKQRSNLMLSNMTFEVLEVKFSGERAEADVVYRSKQSPELSVRVHYLLRRAGKGWEVESSSPLGGKGTNPHSAAPSGPSQLQPSH